MKRSLGFKTDTVLAELVYCEDDQVIESLRWDADRSLARDLLSKAESLLIKHKASFQDIHGIFILKGPGSFTGLRIGCSVANTIAHTLDIPIVGSSGTQWVELGLRRLLSNENDELITPEYGAQPRITQPRK